MASIFRWVVFVGWVKGFTSRRVRGRAGQAPLAHFAKVLWPIPVSSANPRRDTPWTRHSSRTSSAASPVSTAARYRAGRSGGGGAGGASAMGIRLPAEGNWRKGESYFSRATRERAIRGPRGEDRCVGRSS